MNMDSVHQFLVWSGWILTAFGLFAGGAAIVTGKLLEREKRGAISGKIVMEDGTSPALVDLGIYFKGTLVEKIKPEYDGSFSTILDSGTYELQINAKGFISKKIGNIDSLSGTKRLEDILVNVAPKPVTLRLTDKNKTPYRNLTMAIMKGEPPGRSTKYSTDAEGNMSLPMLDFGEYNLTLAVYTSADEGFLWHAGRKHVGHFRLMANQDTYDLILPKIIYSELSRTNSTLTFENVKKEKYLAQSFILSSPIRFCGVGFGVGLGEKGLPNRIQIRADSSGFPASEIIFENSPVSFSGAISTGSEAGYSTFCNEANAFQSLGAGIYWVIAAYDVVPPAISILGGPSFPSTQVGVKASADGILWENAALPSNWKMLDLFIVE